MRPNALHGLLIVLTWMVPLVAGLLMMRFARFNGTRVRPIIGWLGFALTLVGLWLSLRPLF